MSFQLFSVLAAAALVVPGSGSPGETRSAQSLPSSNLALPQTAAGSAGKLPKVNRLTDAPADTDSSGRCKRPKHWDEKQNRCAGGWWLDTGAPLIIGAGTLAGAGYAIFGPGQGSNLGHNSVSN